MDDNVLTLDNEYQEDVDLEGEVFAVGERGYSAYEIALQNGYIGTEEEWLASLEGEDGVTPHIGDNGDWFIGEIDTGLPSRGEPGEGVPEGGTAGQILSKVDGTDYNTEWVDSVCLGRTSEYNTSANALRIDLLEENKVYVLFNDKISGNGSIYVGWENAGSVLTNQVNSIKNVQLAPVIYFQYRQNPEPGETDYNVFMWQDNWYFSANTRQIIRSIYRFYIENNSLEQELYEESVCDAVTINNNQTITGTKIFNTLPTSSVAPTADNQLTNKKYVDDSVEDLKFCLGNITDYNSAGNALDIDQLEEGKTYILMNNVGVNTSGADLFSKVTTETYGVISRDDWLPYNKLKISCYYISKHIYTDNSKTHYIQIYANIMYFTPDYMEKYLLYDIYEENGILKMQSSSDTMYFVLRNQAQTISGVKTFTTLPETSVVPTTNNQLVNKAYVDSIASSIQVDEMPTASQSELDKIVQFVGTTDATYTNGYFYKCVSDGETPPTYSWINVDVQAGGGGQGDDEVYYVYGIDNNNPFIFDGKKKGVYVFDTSHMGIFYYKVNEEASIKNDSNFKPFYMVFDRDIDYDELKDGSRFGGVFYYEPNNGQISFGNYLSFSDAYKVVNWGGAVISKTLTTSAQTIEGIKTFNSIPQQNNTTAPTLDVQYTNKKYVDDAIASVSGGTPDNVTTRLNNNNELETIGIYTQQNTARKIWEGTLTQYNALSSKDSDTYYYITDDNEVNGLPTGGTTGQVLIKSSNSDYDTEWTTQHNFTHETWTFTLDDDTTVDKEVVLW